MGKSKIDWTDFTWNPVVGCSHASPGCAHCYAEKMACRLAAMGQEKYMVTTSEKWNIDEGYVSVGGWSGECFLSESELENPFHWKKSRVIFVSSMGDLFHENVPFEWIDKVIAVIALNPQHTFIFLTKRAERMAAYFNSIEGGRLRSYNILPFQKDEVGLFCGKRWPLQNLWLGVTAENQEMADLRIPILLQIPAALRFVSIEPMLGPVEILNYHPFRTGDKKYGWENQCSVKSNDGMRQCGGHKEDHLAGLGWVILGMETGHVARTFPGAAEAIVNVKDQCVAAGVPFFYKGPQHVSSGIFSGKKLYHMGYWGTKKEKEHIIENIEYRQFPEGK